MSLAKVAAVVFETVLKKNKMTAFYIVLKVIALIAIIIIPLVGPKKKKSIPVKTLSNLSVKENGYLEYASIDPLNHHPVD
jgi:hypothetical protein